MNISSISAGIVNYRCSRDTARAVRSLLAQSVRPEKIILIDNASGDDSVEFLRGEFGGQADVVEIIANPENVGFGAAQNQAIRLTDSEFYLALNPDALLEPDYIEKLIAALRAHPEAGYATGLIYFCEENGTPTPHIFSTGHWWLRGRTAINRYYLLDYPADLMQSGEVGGASGCAPLYRRAMLDDINLQRDSGGGEYFDETYFMYIEDLDLDWRAHLAGWSCWFEKEAVAYHAGEVTGGARKGRVYAQLLVNRWLMILKNDRIAMFLRDLPYMLKADLQHFWPTLIRYGGLRFVFHGLVRRMLQALSKRSIVKKSRKASSRELRRWMNLSLKEIRAFNAWQTEHPDAVRPYGRMAP